MKEWGIQIASERRMRQRVNDMRGESNLLCSEASLFSFACKSGGGDEDCSACVHTTLNSKSGGVPR